MYVFWCFNLNIPTTLCMYFGGWGSSKLVLVWNNKNYGVLIFRKYFGKYY